MRKGNNDRLYWPLLYPKAGWILILLLFSSADGWIAIQLPYLMSITIDQYITQRRIEMVHQIMGQMFILAITGCIIGITIMILSAVFAQSFGNQLRQSLFHRIMSWSWEQNAAHSSGAMLTRMISDTQILSQFVIALLQTLVRPLLVILFSFYSIRRLGTHYVMVLAAAVPIESLLLFFFMRKIKPRFAAMQVILEKTNGYVQKMLASLRLIRVNRRVSSEEERYAEMNQDLYETSLSVQQLIAAMNPLLILILNLAIICTLWVSGVSGKTGNSGIGGILAAILYLQQLLMCLLTMGQLFQSWSRFQISRARIDEIWNTAPPKHSAAAELPKGELLLRCSGVSYRYPRASSETITGADIIPDPGKHIAITGPTGSGKSTFCRLLSGLLIPTEGSITLNGIPLDRLDSRTLHKHVLMVPQNSAVLSGTVRENITFGFPDVSEDEIRQAARIAQADCFIQNLPHGYETMLAERGRSLSGGQRQCIALARALLRKPEILILDDCCSAMDYQTESSFLDQLRAAYPKMTLIFVSNRIQTLQKADLIQILEHGKMTDSGTHSDLCRSNSFYHTASLIQMGVV